MNHPTPNADEIPVQTPPLLRIVKGDPTPEEVAALVSVVSAMTAGVRATGAAARPRSVWAAHYRKVRGTHRHGPGAWRTS